LRQRAVYLLLAVATVISGLLVRFGPLGLPGFVVKYGGSTLWAVMVYWVLVLVWPRSRPLVLASIAGGIALLVELQRLYHAAWLDAIRVSLPGILLLGRFFSVWDIVAYWLAIGAVALFDGLVIRWVARC
jgi:Protein of unknown function (DUF2809)